MTASTELTMATAIAAKRLARQTNNTTPGRFGPYGGRYVPETLMAALEELEREYERAKHDPDSKSASIFC